MPSVVINEKDYTIYNRQMDTDNIVFVPGFSIKGPYTEPVLLQSYADLINTFGSIPTAEQYASSASDATYKMCTSWEYVAQLLNSGFYVLFQRIVPYTNTGAIDETKLINASVSINDTIDGSSHPIFKIKEETGGTFGNNLKVIFTLNANKTKLFLKVVNTSNNETLEYLEVCKVSIDSTTGNIQSGYIYKFAKSLITALDNSKYLKPATEQVGTTVYGSLSEMNEYIKDKLTADNTGTSFVIGSDGIIVPSPALENPVVTSNKIDSIVINPTGATSVRSSFKLGDTASATTNVIYVTGKDYTFNDVTPSEQGIYSALTDQLIGYLDVISDTVLYDVKFVTKGAIALSGKSELISTSNQSWNNAVANFCKTRGDCIAVLEPNINTPSTNVQAEFEGEDLAGYIASYTSAYAPWCVFTLFNGYQRWCPPSLIFINTLAKSVNSGNPVYLPPAGINRALVTEVVKPEYRIGSKILNKWQDKNELRNVNPIMNLNTYGYTIFGQRTLYDVSDAVTTYRSALQEVGVRLTTIECKKRIRKVAVGLIFEYNNIHTWNEFKAGIEPLMRQMVENGALQRYKVIMDGTTTSADDVDDNIIRGTIKIVPGRAVEDFIISFELYRSAVKFDDEEDIGY